MRAYHLVPRVEYERQDPAVEYRPDAFAADGFIHLTEGADELVAVGNRYYRDDPRPYLALVVDLSRVRAPVHYEDPDRTYPHVYGPLNRDAIVGVRAAPRAPDGSFLPLPGEAWQAGRKQAGRKRACRPRPP